MLCTIVTEPYGRMEEVKRMKKYETTFIINSDLDEAGITEMIDKVQDIITSNEGEIVKVEKWGVKKLAYEVKKRRTGFYSCIQFNGVNKTLDELNRRFRIMDNLLKYIIIRLEEK